MIVCKDLKINNPIRTIDEWFDNCPPMGKNDHWKDGRSAKETAKHWLANVPIEFKELVKPLGVLPDLISPEFNSKFDNYKGGVRNHDLLILDQGNEIVIGIESKVDESFSDTIANQLKLAKLEFQKNPRSKAIQRIEDLRKAILGSVMDDQLDLRYQLLYSIAGVISEARIQKYSKAIFVVQTFLSKEMDSEKHRTNQRDLDKFITYVSKGKNKVIHNGDLTGPFRVSGNSFIPNNIDLFIGKIDIKI